MSELSFERRLALAEGGACAHQKAREEAGLQPDDWSSYRAGHLDGQVQQQTETTLPLMREQIAAATRRADDLQRQLDDAVECCDEERNARELMEARLSHAAREVIDLSASEVISESRAAEVLGCTIQEARTFARGDTPIEDALATAAGPTETWALRAMAEEVHRARTQLDEALARRGLDTDERVRFYEHDFYPLSNFSAFTLQWKGNRFDTSEAAYHWEKFPHGSPVRALILTAPSAHEAFKAAERFKAQRRADWCVVKVDVMREILRAKAQQHEYVRRKLWATGDRELVEDSWRDDFWGWGPNRDGQNMLGKLWMEIRAELRAALPAAPTDQPAATTEG